jgi:predicted metal-dependent peptidase
MGLLNHLCQPKVPWDKVLRQFLISRLSSEKEPDYRRPSRRNLAGITSYFEPNRQNKKTIKTLVVCMDLSGSCWCSEVVSKFVSNIDLVQQSCRNKVVLITFDYGINDVIEIPANKKLSDVINGNEVELHGGGGTEFAQPIERAKEYNPDVVVVFTDCYGDFGDQPKFPVVWASIGDSAPWGKNILIDD